MSLTPVADVPFPATVGPSRGKSGSPQLEIAPMNACAPPVQFAVAGVPLIVTPDKDPFVTVVLGSNPTEIVLTPAVKKPPFPTSNEML